MNYPPDDIPREVHEHYEALVEAKCITSEIADTGDYDSQWHIEDVDGRKSYGKTFFEAIQDAMKSDDDPTRYDYIPPEFR